MSRWTLRPGMGNAFLPGVGRVNPGQILHGDLAKFSSVLVEILEEPTPEPVAPLLMDLGGTTAGELVVEEIPSSAEPAPKRKRK